MFSILLFPTILVKKKTLDMSFAGHVTLSIFFFILIFLAFSQFYWGTMLHQTLPSVTPYSVAEADWNSNVEVILKLPGISFC